MHECRACSSSHRLAQTSPRLAGTAREQSLVGKIPKRAIGKKMGPKENSYSVSKLKRASAGNPSQQASIGPVTRGPLACCHLLWSSPQSVMAVNSHQATQPLAPALCRPVVWNTPGSDPATTSHPASKV